MAFSKVNPELNGDVPATVLAHGQVFLTVGNQAVQGDVGAAAASVLVGFLQFLEQQMSQRPDMIEPVDQAQLARIAALVDGVEADD